MLKKHCPQTCEACEPDASEPVEFCADHLRDEENAQYECGALSGMGVCQADPAPPPAAGQGADVTEYRYQDRPWYKALRALPVTKTLTQADFASGTFRITEPGRYQLLWEDGSKSAEGYWALSAKVVGEKKVLDRFPSEQPSGL